MRLAGCEGILFWCTVVLSLEAWLGSTVTAADLSRQRLSLYHWRWEPACIQEKVEECAKTGQTCDEATGECTCEPPKVIVEGMCREPACTEEKKEECYKTGKTCNEPTGKCTCEPPKVIEGGVCRACPIAKVYECARTGKTCNKLTGHCVCKFPKVMEAGTCRACTREKLKECAETGQTCDELTGKCTCKFPKMMEDATCRACTRGMVDHCAETGRTCDELTGYCVCKAPKEMEGGICRACTEEKVEECAETGQTCDELTGECTCKFPKMMEDGTCREPACTMGKKLQCHKKMAKCTEPDGECVCAEGLKMFNGTCKEPACTMGKKLQCHKKMAKCTEPDGECVCAAGLKMINGTCKEPACTMGKKLQCHKKMAKCTEPDGECVCAEGLKMFNGTCKEPACTMGKKLQCHKKMAKCTEPDGECVCAAGLKMINGTCKEPACTMGKKLQCHKKMAKCTEPDGECVCAEGLKMFNGTCKEPACTMGKKLQCHEKLAKCTEPDGECVCAEGLKMFNGTCKEPACTMGKKLQCHKKMAKCVQPDGECVCAAGLKMIHGTCKVDAPEAAGFFGEATSTVTQSSEWQSSHTTDNSTEVPVIPGPCSGTGECSAGVCKRPRCLCASDAPPAGVRVEDMPQFVLLTFDGAVNAGNMAFYRELLNISSRKNKQNGCGIAATFFTSAEYLDYEAVNQLHSWGNEIALKSISHRTDSSYWQTINSTQWEREVLDQREMLTAFASVPFSDVTGFRGPFLNTGGDQGFQMLHKHFRYDSTLVHQRARGERPFYPYTMDFGFRRSCNVWPCPEGSYPGLWVLPINVLFPKHTDGDLPCAMADACLPLPVTAEDTFEYFRSNFEEFYTTNRAPFPVFLHEAYLKHPERKAGYLRFVDWLLQKDDVYFVTATEVLRFMEDPEPLSAYAKRPCTGGNVRGPSTCPRPTTCSYKNTPPGGERYMRTCSRCPKNYPWVNNPLGN
ncbi:uncharacterized protein LOC144158796 isoform X1 [Haemaphysalis longicornis]